MKRFWLGIGILILFLAVGLWSSLALESTHMPMSQTLEQAAQAAMAGDMEAGTALARRAKQDWEDAWHPAAILADHTPMDEIDALFARAEAFSQGSSQVDFAAHCMQLSKLIEATVEAHTLTWWNIL